jgi:hypothetical protein
VSILLLSLPAFAAGQQRAVDIKLVREYLDKMQLKYVPHPKSPDAVFVPITENSVAERVDLYIEARPEHTLVLTAYPKLKGKYLNISRAAAKEKLFQKLLEINFRSFASFFVDEQGDIGVRFTFTTEDGLGYDSFSVTVSEVARIADEYTKTLDDFMRKE